MTDEEQVAAVHERLGDQRLVAQFYSFRDREISSYTFVFAILGYFMIPMVTTGGFLAAVDHFQGGGPGLFTLLVIVWLGLTLGGMGKALSSGLRNNHIIYEGDIRQVRWNKVDGDLLNPPFSYPPVRLVLQALARERDAQADGPPDPPEELAAFLRSEAIRDGVSAGSGAVSVADNAHEGALSAAAKASQRRTDRA